MKRHTQVILYHLLPVVFWLLAVGGTVLPIVLSHLSPLTFHLSTNYYWGFLVAALVMLVIAIMGRIRPRASIEEPCFQAALVFGIASYWLPTVVFLTLPIAIYLYNKHLFNFRSFMAFVVGYALVAIWATIGIYLGWIANPWAEFFAAKNAWGWIPTGAALIAWLASTIARQTLRVR